MSYKNYRVFLMLKNFLIEYHDRKIVKQIQIYFH